MDIVPSQRFASSASQFQDHGLKIWSCVTCRRRKVKCDRKDPCANCVRNNIECHFPVTGRLPRRSRDPNVWKSPAQKQSELVGRLRRLENLVTELTGQVEGRPDGQIHSQFGSLGAYNSTGQSLQDPTMTVGGYTSSSASQAHESSTGETSRLDSQLGGEIYEDFGRLVIERAGALQVDKGFWSIFCDEVEHIFQAIHDDSYGVQDATSQAHMSKSVDSVNDHCHGFVFGGPQGGPCTSMTTSLDDLSPLPSQMLYIWKSYVDNVDPFVKVLHIPSMDAVVFKLRAKFSSLGHSMEALMFAISLAAVVSLEEEEVMDSFRVPKTELISRFRLCTERALAHTQFLTTNDIIIFQAFIIYVAMLPHIGEQKLASSLTGSLLRVAGSLKLHIDPDNAKQKTPLNRIEVECRRRLWWQVCFIDSRTRDARLPDLSISESSFDTKPPSNVDETQLRGDGICTEVPGTNPTGMTLTLIRCENWLLYRSIRRQLDASINAHLDILREARNKIETIYIQHLQPNNEFDCLIKTMSHLFFAKIEQGIHRHCLRRSNTNAVGKRPNYDPKLLAIFFNSSIAILEAMHNLRTNPAWQGWRWQLQGQFPWQTVGAVFIQICQLPWTWISEKAWTLAMRLVDGLPPESRKELLWDRLNNLAGMVATHRDSQIAKAKQWDIENTHNTEIPTTWTPTLPTSAIGPAGSGSEDADLFNDSFSNNNDQFMSWAKSNDTIPFEFYDDTTFLAIVGSAWPNGGNSNDDSFGMTDVPAEWQDWDDLINMDIF